MVLVLLFQLYEHIIHNDAVDWWQCCISCNHLIIVASTDVGLLARWLSLLNTFRTTCTPAKKHTLCSTGENHKIHFEDTTTAVVIKYSWIWIVGMPLQLQSIVECNWHRRKRDENVYWIDVCFLAQKSLRHNGQAEMMRPSHLYALHVCYLLGSPGCI